MGLFFVCVLGHEWIVVNAFFTRDAVRLSPSQEETEKDTSARKGETPRITEAHNAFSSSRRGKAHILKHTLLN